jgi:hypothetical protein
METGSRRGDVKAAMTFILGGLADVKRGVIVAGNILGG